MLCLPKVFITRPIRAEPLGSAFLRLLWLDLQYVASFYFRLIVDWRRICLQAGSQTWSHVLFCSALIGDYLFFSDLLYALLQLYDRRAIFCSGNDHNVSVHRCSKQRHFYGV